MNKLRLFLLLCSSILCCSFSFYHFLGFNDDSLPKVDVVIDQMLGKALKELKKEYDISICGLGGSQVKGKETTIDVSFQFAKILTQKECRELIIDCSRVLLQYINQDEALKPFLVHSPFVSKDIVVFIFLSQPDYDTIYHPNISSITLSNDLISYYVKDPDIDHKYTIIDESYEEALKALLE